ncbi:hypothetical protein KQI65_10755 [bacterium]|nr:hypothetical protein [bacterium]
MRSLFIICMFLLVSFNARAQEREGKTQLPSAAPSAAAQPLDEEFFLQQREAIRLPALRRYLELQEMKTEELALHNAFRVERLLTKLNHDGTNGLSESILLTQNVGLPFARFSGDADLLEAVGAMLFEQAVQLTYQYARESTRRGSLTEFDYLALPQGRGVTRTMGESRESALQRGERQSWSVWEEKYFMQKNQIRMSSPDSNR